MTDRQMRGFRFRAYPTAEQEVQITEIEQQLRRSWNWLCARSADTARANDAWAARQTDVGPMPVRPDYDGMSPEESAAARRAHQDAWRSWRAAAAKALKAAGGPKYRSILDWQKHFWHPEHDQPTAGKGKEQLHDYQVFRRALDGIDIPGSYLQAMCKSYQAAMSATKRGQRPPKRRKSHESMSVRTMSGGGVRGKHPLLLEPAGPRPGCPNGRADWCDASLKMPGVTGRIACRIGPESMARLDDPSHWVCGASLVREPDGWYAAIRQRVLDPPAVPAGDPGAACGIDVGLIDLAAIACTDDTTAVVPNPRSARWLRDHIAARQAADKPVGKALARAARNTRQIVRERIFTVTDRCQQIYIEDLGSRIGQMGCAHVSFMRTLRTMLIMRYGADRVREVDPCYTSQDCSQCGERSKDTWACDAGRVGSCPACGHSEHRDVNAARNILRKGLDLQG